MENFAGLLALAIGVFVTTDIDDIFVLVGFFSDPKFKARQIALGQLLGVTALYGASVAISLLSLVISPAYIGFLGILPIVIGLKSIWDLRTGSGSDDHEEGGSSGANGYGNLLSVAAVTVANGGDNLSVYTPLFATRSGVEVTLFGVVFAAMTLIWVALAYWLTRHHTLGAPIRRYGSRVVPFVLVALGFYILHEAGTLALVRHWV